MTNENEKQSQELSKNKSIETINVQTTAFHALVVLGLMAVLQVGRMNVHINLMALSTQLLVEWVLKKRVGYTWLTV